MPTGCGLSEFRYTTSPPHDIIFNLSSEKGRKNKDLVPGYMQHGA